MAEFDCRYECKGRCRSGSLNVCRLISTAVDDVTRYENSCRNSSQISCVISCQISSALMMMNTGELSTAAPR